MDSPPPRDDLLLQPTRARLFELLAELKRPAPTEELARRLALHPNGVRQHLERMREAGLVRRDRPRQAVGRPRDEWSIAPDARPGGEPPSGYEELGRWLALAINPSRKQLREIEAVGRQIGTDLVASSSTTPSVEVMHTTLSALGFQPRCQVGQTVTYTLGNCPYRDAARENQPVICTLHRGITRGLLDTVAPASRLVEFTPKDPDAAGCIIEIDGLD